MFTVFMHYEITDRKKKLIPISHGVEVIKTLRPSLQIVHGNYAG